MTDLPPGDWCVIVEANGKPFDDWDGAIVLFSSQKAARRWLAQSDARVERWDGVGAYRTYSGDA